MIGILKTLFKRKSQETRENIERLRKLREEMKASFHEEQEGMGLVEDDESS